MTVVFVHGALETEQLWSGVLPLLGVGSGAVAVPLPSHGTLRPAEFTATKDAYPLE